MRHDGTKRPSAISYCKMTGQGRAFPFYVSRMRVAYDDCAVISAHSSHDSKSQNAIISGGFTLSMILNRACSHRSAHSALSQFMISENIRD